MALTVCAEDRLRDQPKFPVKSSTPHSSSQSLLSITSISAAKTSVAMEAPLKKRRKLSHSAGDASAAPDRKDPRTLFVRNLAPATTSDDLTQHFSQTYP